MRSLKTAFLTTMMIPMAAAAFANDADFRMVNRTGYQIEEVYVSSANNTRWGADILGRQTLGDGQRVTITFPHGNGACVFDIKVKYTVDSSTAEWSGVDLCKYETITLYWDEKNQVTRAVGE